MTLDECAKIAQDKGFDSMEFLLVGPTGKEVPVRWEDAYMGAIMTPMGLMWQTTAEQIGCTAKVI
jgi:hypothetical protein